MAPLDLTLSELDMSNTRALTFLSIISRIKGVYLRHTQIFYY